MPERPPQSHPIYRLHNLTKTYDDRLVLDLDDLEIYRAEILAIVGPSGAGKSTLLRLLNFIEQPTSGQIVFKDVVFQAGREMPLSLRRKVTTVFQRPMLLERSVRDNVAYGLRLRGKRDASGKIDATLNQVGLDRLARQRARTLSGGEAQRVALARAMLIDPEVLLLDEPTANLDPYNVGLIEDIITDLNHRQGVTLVMVTHNVFQARRLADRVVFLLEGKLVEVAEVERFFEEPSDPRTHAFVNGEMVY
jgi:tungstate transport system ATP-binding protein